MPREVPMSHELSDKDINKCVLWEHKLVGESSLHRRWIARIVATFDDKVYIESIFDNQVINEEWLLAMKVKPQAKGIIKWAQCERRLVPIEEIKEIYTCDTCPVKFLCYTNLMVGT